MISDLTRLLKEQFPNAQIQIPEESLSVGSFPEWDSLGHFNYLLLVEQHYGIRFSVEEMSELKSLLDISKALASKEVAV